MVENGIGHEARPKATQLPSPHGAKISLSNRQCLPHGALAEKKNLVVPEPEPEEG